MNQQVKTIECPQHRERVLREALAEAREVLQDHLVMEAAEHCYPGQVEQANERFRQRGGRINATAEVAGNITEVLGDG